MYLQNIHEFGKVLRWDGSGWWLEDLGSRNGTMLNDLKLVKPTPLAEGDVIGIGALRLRLEAAD